MEPFSPPELCDHEVVIQQRLLGAGLEIAVQFGGDPMVLRFQQARLPLDRPIEIGLQIEEVPAILRVMPSKSGAWGKRYRLAPPLDDIPEPFRSALVTALNGEILDAIEPALNLGIESTGTLPVIGEPHPIPWKILNADREEEAIGELVLPTASVGRILEQVRGDVVYRDPSWLDAVPFELPVLIPATKVSRQTLRRWRVGDVLLLEVSSIEALTAIAPLKGGPTFSCNVSPELLQPSLERGRGLLMNQEPPSDEKDVRGTEDAMADESQSDWTDDMTVELQFQVGSLNLKLEQLRSLDEGHVFELQTPLEQPITLLVNGAKIGSGDLVKVGDRLGVVLRSRDAA